MLLTIFDDFGTEPNQNDDNNNNAAPTNIFNEYIKYHLHTV